MKHAKELITKAVLVINEDKDMPMLYVRCKICGTKFASGISVDKKSFETLTLKNNHHKCPRGHLHSYNKEDYFF